LIYNSLQAVPKSRPASAGELFAATSVQNCSSLPVRIGQIYHRKVLTQTGQETASSAPKAHFLQEGKIKIGRF
jgi:hypothetical protein